MIRRTLAIAVKEFLHLRRDPKTALTLLGMPMVLLLIYGFALSFDVRDIRLAIIDQDGGRAARGVTQAFLRSDYFVLAATGEDPRVLDDAFDRGTVQAALVIPATFSTDLAAGRPTVLQFVLDGSDAQTATTILAYGRQIVASVSPVIRVGMKSGPVVGVPLIWYNPDLRSPWFLIPGLLAFILMVTAVIATAMAVVREKERGTIESLRATPLVAIELLIGKSVPYLALASGAAAGSLILAWALFGVPLRGSLVWLAVVTVLFVAGGLGWGMLISTIADSQQVAFQMGLLSSMLPTLLLSGFIFPISSMPAALQWITHIIPARYFLLALRSIILKGVGPEIWWPDLVALVVYGVIVLALATARMVRSL